MIKNKKPDLSRKGKKRLKREISLVLRIVIIAFSIILMEHFFINEKIIYKEEIKYFSGNLYSINQAANMIDLIETKENIIISPFNINSSLGIMYSATDNNSNKEIKQYFKKSIEDVNEELITKISKLEYKEKEKNKFDILYENYIKKLNEKGYSSYKINNIESLKTKEKESLILLLKRIQLTSDRIKKLNNLSINSIKQYKLNKNEISYNSYNIKSLIDSVLDEYENYQIENNVTNYHHIFLAKDNKDKIEKEFSEIIKSYNSSINFVNFSLKETAAKKINESVQKSTNEKIKRVIEPKEINDESLFMINGLHFNYKWEKSFNNKKILNEEFYNYDDTIGIVEMMYDIENIYFENKYAKGFKKTFEGNKYSFIGILPNKTGDFKLSTLDLESLISSEKTEKVKIGIPNFSYQSEIDMKKLLKNYNIKEIFTPHANFSQMTNNKVNNIKVIQKSSINIAQKGTENSNVILTSFENETEEESLKKIILNRPFAYLIINNETNDILLIGKITSLNGNNTSY